MRVGFGALLYRGAYGTYQVICSSDLLNTVSSTNLSTEMNVCVQE
jgi:hypothetical protein